MNMKNITFLFVILAVLITGCAAGRADTRSFDESVPAAAPVAEFAASEGQALAGDNAGFNRTAASVEPLVIRTANLVLVVEDPSASADTIGELAKELGGFVVFSNVFQTNLGDSSSQVTRASITIRVPSEKLDTALDQIEQDSIEVRESSVRGEDVTQQYTDLQSRLRNLEAAEEQLREIMASAVKTEDVLRVFQDLSSVREQIEVIKGQINFFEDSARLSSVSVELIPDELAQPLQIGGWRPEGTAKEALETLIRTVQIIIDAGIWAAICIVPVALILGLPGYYAARGILNRRKSKQSDEPEEETT